MLWRFPCCWCCRRCSAILTVDGTLGDLVAAVLCIGALASIYTEFLVLALLDCRRVLRVGIGPMAVRVAALPGVCGAAGGTVVLQPALYEMTSFLTSPLMTRPGVLKHIYPWAYDVVRLRRGLVRRFLREAERPLQEWYPFVVLCRPDRRRFRHDGLVALATTTAWHAGGAERRQIAAGGFDLALALLALGLIPVVMLSRDTDHHYQFFKILITVSPLYALGMVALAVLAWPRLISANVTRPLASCAAVLPHGCRCSLLRGSAGTGTAALRVPIPPTPKLWFRIAATCCPRRAVPSPRGASGTRMQRPDLA